MLHNNGTMKNENFPLVRIYSYWLRTRRDPRGILILDVGANFTLLPYRVASCHPALQMWKELFRERTYATTAAICEFIEISSCRIRRWLHVYHGRVVIARLSYEWNGSGSTDSIPASENWGLNQQSPLFVPERKWVNFRIELSFIQVILNLPF